MHFKIPLYKPLIGSLEKKNVNECLNTNWISSKGKFVSLFENKFKKFIKAPYAVSVCNGTAALHLALLALKIKENNEVLVPTFTYVATVNAIKYVGAKVKFIDSKLNDWQINEDEIEKKITKKTRALIVPHIYGQVCNIQKISKICFVFNI
jgi:perosamine synthetase